MILLLFSFLYFPVSLSDVHVHLQWLPIEIFQVNTILPAMKQFLLSIYD